VATTTGRGRARRTNDHNAHERPFVLELISVMAARTTMVLTSDRQDPS
jgi:hypothetical protein